MPKRLAFLAVLSLALVAPVAAQRSLAIDSFASRIVVERNSDLDITETVTASFTGSWNGIYRKIPVEYHSPQGFNWTIRLGDIRATDAEGHPLRVEQDREGAYLKLKIWVPGAHDATRTIALHYTAAGGLRYFEDHDELYWNATGDEWDVPLGMVSAEVDLPDGARGVHSTAFNGAYGSASKDALIDSAGGHLTFRIPRKLDFHEGLTVVVGWDKGLVAVPTFGDKVRAFLRDNWPVGLPLPVFALMFLLWYRNGRDPRLRPITTQYEPPKEMTPGEAGTITDESVDMRDITATMIDLAVRGFIKIDEHDKGTFVGIHLGKDYTFTVTNPKWDALAPHEQRLLRGMFGGSSSVDLSDLKNEFYQEVAGIQSAVFDRLVQKGYYRSRPDRVRMMWRVGGVIVIGAFTFIGSSVATQIQMTPVPFIVGGVLSGIIVLIFGQLMPARTEEGTRALESVLGYGEFLRRVDSDRFERIVKTPEMFEQGLPYAMALGVEGHWAKAFQGIYTTPPRWYGGVYPGQFNAVYFSNSLSSLSQTASTTMSSQPRTSGGSGFSGGGFSGGGGGGGGGGGF